LAQAILAQALAIRVDHSEILSHIPQLIVTMACKHVCEWFSCLLIVVRLQVVFPVTEPDLAIHIQYSITGKWSEVEYKMIYGIHDGSDRNSKWEEQLEKGGGSGWELVVAFKAWTWQATNLSANSNATFKCFHTCHRSLPSYSGLVFSASTHLNISRFEEYCDSFDANRFCVTADWPGAEKFVLGYFERGGMEKREDMTMVFASADPMFLGGDASDLGDHFSAPPPIRYMSDPNNVKHALNASVNRWDISDTFFAERLGSTTCIGGYELDVATGKCTACQMNSWRDIFAREKNLKCTRCQNYSCNFAPGGLAAAQCTCDAGYMEEGPSRRRRGWKACQPCSVGHFASARFFQAGAEECRPCEQGYFSNASASEKCAPCAAGKFMRKGGASACELCAPGRISTSPGSLECSKCSIGTATAAVGTTACERCDLGWFAPDLGMSNCTECDAGLSTAALGAALATECICPRGTFLTQTVPTMVCSKCFEGMICEAGSVSWDLSGDEAFQGMDPHHPQLKAGFMVKNSDKDIMVYKCADTEACPGGEIGLCGLGRDPEIVACAECPSRFYISSKNECKPCLGEHNTRYSMLQAAMLAVGGFAAVAVLMAKQSRDRGVYASTLTTMSIFSSVFNVAKQLVNQLQIMGAFSGIRIDWPVTIKRMISTWSTWSETLLEFGQFGMSCAFPDFALQWVIESLVPFFVPLSGAVLYVLVYPIRCCRPGARDWVTLPRIVTATGFSCMLFYISVSRKAIAPLECFKHPKRTRESSMTQHPSVLCGRGDHAWMLALGIFFCLLYPVGILAWFLTICYMAPSRFARNTNVNLERGMVFVNRFLFSDFRFEHYWWAPVSMVRDLLLACTCSFVPSHPVYQLQLDALWLLIYLVLCTYFWPYGESGQSLLDMVRIACALIMLGTASYFAALSSDVEVDSDQVSEINMAISFFTCWFIGSVLVVFSISENLRPQFWEKAKNEREQSIADAIGALNSVIDEIPMFLQGISAQNARKLQLILHRGLQRTSAKSMVPLLKSSASTLAGQAVLEEYEAAKKASAQDMDKKADAVAEPEKAGKETSKEVAASVSQPTDPEPPEVQLLQCLTVAGTVYI